MDSYLPSDDPVNKKAILCTNIPESFLEKSTAKEYFAQFGRVNRFILRPSRMNCTVEFEDTTGPENMFAQGANYNGQVFDISYMPLTVARLPKTMEEIIRDPDIQFEPQGADSYNRQSMNTTKLNFQKSKAIESNPSNETAIAELVGILKEPAFTADDKFRALDARDKLFRLLSTKTTDISQLGIMNGFCPDMCPEKERWMREAKHQIAAYELEANTRNVIKHSVAIKQYSRSSADQESPLLYELRPEPVLRRTMTYLMHEIMDLCDQPDTNISDWFHFVWDRTRSIRKDITQQELCSQGSVRLVEQCARFHIHCSARLIAEEPNVFDQKINTENLTKCLQSLKYMYHDLGIAGERCINESEFRGYVVLLNLNDSNFLWEIKQLPESILKSPEIRFALEVFMSIENNSYVKFFQLVRQTTYLNACILLRYFNQVRTKALVVMLKAYAVRTRVELAVPPLTYMLAFEDDNATYLFLEYYGMQCDRENERVILDRTNFEYPDIPFLLERAINVVEHKRITTVGETISGGPLDAAATYQRHQLQDSFDSDGLLCDSSLWQKSASCANVMTKIHKLLRTGGNTTNDSTVAMFKVPSQLDVSPVLLPAEPIRKPTLQFSSKLIETVAPPVLPMKTDFLSSSSEEDFIKSTSFRPGSSIFAGNVSVFPKPFSPNLNFQKNVSNAFVVPPKTELKNSETQLQPIVDIAKNEKAAQMKEKEMEQNRRLEKSKRKVNETSALLCEALLNDLVREELQRIAKTESAKHEQLGKLVETIADKLIDSFVASFARQTVDEEFIVLTVTLFRNFRKLQTIFKRWKRMTEMRISNRRSIIETTPIWIPTQSFHTQMTQLVDPRQKYNLHNIGQYLQGVPKPLAVPQIQQADEIDLFACVGDDKVYPVYWKVVISIPAETEDVLGYGMFLDKWLSKAFKRRAPRDPEYFFLEKLKYDQLKQATAICIRKLCGISLTTESGIVDKTIMAHSNGIVFFMSSVRLESARKRLHNLIEASKSVYSPMPLALIVYGEQELSKEILYKALDLNKRIDDNKLMVISINFVRDFVQMKLLTKLATASLNFCSSYNDTAPLRLLAMQSSVKFVECCLGEEFWVRIENSSNVNAVVNKAIRSYSSIVALYNKAIDKVLNMCTEDYDRWPDISGELRKILDPNDDDNIHGIGHFPIDWKSKSRMAFWQKFFPTLKLRKSICANVKIDNISVLQDVLMTCATENLSEYPQKDVERVGYGMIQVAVAQLNNADATIEMSSFSWISAVRILALNRLAFQWDAVANMPREIIYNRKIFDELYNTSWWLHGSPLSEARLNYSTLGTDSVDSLPPASKKTKYDFDIDNIIANGLSSLERAEKKFQKNSDFIRNSKLDSGYEFERKLFEIERAGICNLSKFSQIDK